MASTVKRNISTSQTRIVKFQVMPDSGQFAVLAVVT
jgi:hypothetical protein